MRSVRFARALTSALVVTIPVAGFAGSAFAQGKEPSCTLAPPARIKKYLGLTVQEPREALNPPVTVCSYFTSNAGSMIVRFEVDSSAEDFLIAREGFDASGQDTEDLKGVGDDAFTTSIGAGTIVANSVIAIKGSTEVLVTSSASLKKTAKLVKKLLTLVKT